MSLNTAFDCVAGVSTALLVFAGVAATPSPPKPQAAEPRVVEVVARRFAFEPTRIEVTEGETIRLMVRSADGVHGIGIKKFKVAEEIPRGGQPVMVEFTALAVGEFEILCSEYCGKGHEGMKGKLVVRSREGARR
jgi:cytochrome c oxidase subunit 2